MDIRVNYCCMFSTLVLLLCELAYSVVADSNVSYERKREKLFHNSTFLMDRHVTCENGNPSTTLKFPTDTWTCYNMKIDGLRMRYWYHPGFGSETSCTDKDSNGKALFDGKNDIPALCRMMMQKHGSDKQLWTTFIDDPSCRYSQQKRVIFKKHHGDYAWETVSPGKGFVITLRCAADM